MMKRLLYVFTLVLALSITAFAQWTLAPLGKGGIDTLKGLSGGHGVVVDPEGKVWVAAYKPSISDSMINPDDNKYVKVGHVYVFDTNGVAVPFSPIKSVSIGGKVNPLFLGTRGVTGINKDKDGNIIVSVNYSLYKINYKTGEGMARFDYPGNAGITKAACDTLGNVYISATLADLPLIKMDTSLANSEVLVEKVPDIGRTLEVSPDGNTIYAARFTGATCYLYKRADEFSPYSLTDTVFRGWKIEAMAFNPANHLLYASAGSLNDVPEGAYGPGQPDKFITLGTYYGVNTSNFMVEDSLAWKRVDTISNPTFAPRNRGIGFTNDGKTAYLVQYNVNEIPILERFVNAIIPKPAGMQKEMAGAVEKYSLLQNYPNPFNPTTGIRFSVAAPGLVTLKVFDILGREVATLVNSQMAKGSYTVAFSGKNLTSGMYIYQLNANGVVLSRKMTLLK